MSNKEAIEFSKRLNEALDLRNYPSLGRGRINYIQEIFNVSRAGATKWLHGKAIPHAKKRLEIASKLGVNLKWLEMGAGTPHDKDDSIFQFSHNMVREIPLLNMKQAHEYNDDTTVEEHLVVSGAIPKNTIAIRNSSTAMDPKMPVGAVIIAHLGATIVDGDYVIAKTPALPEIIVRQFIAGSENDYLVAINNKFDTIEISAAIQIIAKVIEIRSSL